MSTSSHAEILEYLQHGDADLAVRRLLDYCLDTVQDALISESIRLSQAYHQATEIGPLSASFMEYHSLIDKAAATCKTYFYSALVLNFIIGISIALWFRAGRFQFPLPIVKL